MFVYGRRIVVTIVVYVVFTMSTMTYQQNETENIMKEYETLFAKHKRFIQFSDGYDKRDDQITENYDFIIVGSGPAGSVLANRLSEIPHWKILLLEVGEVATILTDIPMMAALFQVTNYNWGYLMEKQDNFGLGLVDQRMAWPRGRALGGTSIINYMIHVRGNKIDYDRWAAQGNPGWSYDEVLPYFLKSENAHIQLQDPGYHRQGGLLNVQDIPFRTESAHTFVRAAQEVGHKYVDYNGASQLGVSYVQGTLRRGLRCSAEKAFLRPARSRPNLTILPKSRVTKVLIDPISRRAYGVNFARGRKNYVARASKEVILSAGAFNSPQLLMLSGIGPQDHLEELKIPVIKSLPVGQKLYDHISFQGLTFTVNASITIHLRDVVNPSVVASLLLENRGPLTILGGVESLTFVKTNISKETEDYPDVELIFTGSHFGADGEMTRKTFRIADNVYNAVFKPISNTPGWQVFPMLLHPKSFGYLKLKSKNPFHWPKFYGNYFTDPENIDMKTMIASIREIQRIAKAPAMQQYNAQLLRTPIPGCERLPFDSDAYWECAIRHVSPTLHHQVATCKMGPSYDPEAVVDNRLKVHGISNLRVVDTSIIPNPPSAHTNIPSYMIGEKAADLIKDDWR